MPDPKSPMATVVLPRHGKNHTSVSDKLLASYAAQLKEKGTVEFRGTDCKVSEVEVTERGVEVIFGAPRPLIEDMMTTRFATMSMGCIVEEPPTCPLCEAGHRPTKAAE